MRNYGAYMLIALMVGAAIFAIWILPKTPIPYDTDIWEGGEPRIDPEKDVTKLNRDY